MAPADIFTLQLIGYETGAGHGFGLPLFGQQLRPNTLYTALCEPSGDHRGAITSFQLYDAAAPHWLPSNKCRSISVGDSWVDVFVWRDQVLCGDPDTMWQILAPIRAELQTIAPISLLDAAINAEVSDRDVVASSALAFMTSKHSQDIISGWSLQTLAKQAGVLIRRHVPALSFLDISDGLRNTAKGVELRLAVETIEALEKQGVLSSIANSLNSFSTALGLGALSFKSRSKSSATVVPYLDAPVEDDPLLDDADNGVLVITFGRRAKTIGRHLTEAPWLPLLGKGKPSTRGEAKPAPFLVVEGLARNLFVKPMLNRGILMILADDEFLIGEQRQAALSVLSDLPLSQTTRIVVPALPEKHPSPVFSRSVINKVLKSFDAAAVLDTAQARSPFWWGNEKRSLDRRIADIISTVGTALWSLPPWQNFDRLSDGARRVMTLGVDVADQWNSQLTPAFFSGSENSWQEEDGKSEGFRSEFEVVSRDNGSRRRAVIDMRRLGNFRGFARASLTELQFDTAPRYGELKLSPALAEALTFPEQCVLFELDSQRARLRLLLTAETPGLRVLQAASRDRCQVVRYTDRETISALFNSDLARKFSLPAEISVSPMHSSKSSARIATRGVDSRDIIRLSAEEFEAWTKALPSGEADLLRMEMRPLRVGIRPGVEEEIGMVAIRRKWLSGRVESDRAVRTLARIRGVRSRQLLDYRNYKRASDLDACWKDPPDNSMRFALADGQIPPVVFRLDPHEIVLQDNFIVDGDWSVSALLRSRIFSVWARATLSRSSSWMSRFSIGETFAGFPLLPPFSIRNSGALPWILTCADKEIISRARDADHHVQRIYSRANLKKVVSKDMISEISADPIVQRAEALILDTYGLPESSTDLKILRRLIELNRQLS